MRKRVPLLITAMLALVACSVTVIVVTTVGAQHRARQAAVSAARGGSIELGGAHLLVPAGAVSGDGQLTASMANPPRAIASPGLLVGMGSPVHFSVTGTRVVGSLVLTFRVAPGTLPASVPGTAAASAVWLSFYDQAARQWQAVPSTYNPATGTVTAHVSHLSWWQVWTWDWGGIARRVRQGLSAFGSGRAPAVSCPGVHGVAVTSEGGSDPPLIGCPAKAGADKLSITVTNNRGLSVVMSEVPSDATPDPPSYDGYYQYLATSAAFTKAVGGVMIPATATRAYTIPLHGFADVFTAKPTETSYAFDLAYVAGESFVGKAKFGKLSGDYAACLLHVVARSKPPSLADAPDLAVSCLHVLADLVPGYRSLAKVLGKRAVAILEGVVFDIRLLLQTGDLAYDKLRNVQVGVVIDRPSCASVSCQPKWAAVGKVAPGPIQSVSCTGPFCAAVGAAGTLGHSHGYALTYQAGAWSKPVPLGSGDKYAVSCPGGAQCMAVTDSGYAYELHGTTWSAATDIYRAANDQLTAADAIEDLSCATPSFCVATTSLGKALTWNGTGWSAPQSIPLPGLQAPPFPGVYNYVGVSCPAKAFCLAGTGITFIQAPAATWDGTRWTAAPPSPVYAVNWNASCVSANFCMAVGGAHASGDLSSIWDGSSWSPLAHPHDAGGSLGFNQVSCPRAGYCVAVDPAAGYNGTTAGHRGGAIFTWSGGAWTGPQLIDTTGSLDAISCSPAGLCAAADSNGDIFMN